MLLIAAAALMGFALGANDGGNLFGTAVATRVLRFRTAAILAGICIVLGAAFQGQASVETIRAIADQDVRTSAMIVLSAGITVACMTGFKLPVSTTQALVGAILGMMISLGHHPGDQGLPAFLAIRKILLCWMFAPIGAMLAAMLIYYLFGFILNRLPISLLSRDNIILSGLVLVGMYGSYAFGANNAANVVGVLQGPLSGWVSPPILAALGGLVIALGILFFGRRLMLTIGAGLIQLDGFSALVVILAEAITLHLYTMIGVPVSASQAVIGAVLGVGLIRGAEAIQYPVLKNILLGWFLTPLIGCILAAAGYALWIGPSK